MNRRISTFVLAALAVAVFAFQSVAAAQQTTMLELKSKKGDRLQYTLTLGGTLDMDLNELPIPRSKIKVDNLKGAVVANVYLENIDTADGVCTYDVKAVVDRLILGDLLKLDGIGIKSTTLSPQITISIDPTGKVTDIKMADLPDMKKGMGGKLPGLDMLGLGSGGLNDVITMVVGLMPSVLPDKPVAVGETWNQEINFDQMGMGAFLPRFPFEFKLLSVKDGVADIAVTATGKFDGAFLNNLLALIPEIPLGDDILKISNVNLLVNWDGSGDIKLDTAAGRVNQANMSTTFNITLGADASFKHPDDSNDKWKADGTVKLVVDADIKYAGAPSAADVNDLFPKEEPEQAKEPSTPAKKPAKKPAGKKKI